ncbi:hypothetical protein AHF37_08869 [Paragonimus kellicotti]|nr:hypothetical protein AHF37_08869 [Paragonimus kellicotti]
MPGNATSGSDSAEGADDEDSESSSLPATSAKLRATLPTSEESLEAFYQDWMSEVERSRIGTESLLPINSGSLQPQVFPDSTPVFVHNSDLNPLFQSSVSTGGSALVDQLVEVKTSDELSGTVLQPDKDTLEKTHISVLPHELLLRIFRWAVGNHLDMRVLGKLACVCRGFRLLAYDPCLWRAICVRRWPTLTKHPLAGDVYPPQTFGYATWRDMAIQRPHVLLDGCYLCRISYVRAGEVHFGVYYRPMHLVVYYRGIRFYPDGRVSMLTSSHTPNAVVAALGKQGVYTPDYHQSGTLTGSTTTPAHPLDGTMQDSLCDAGGGFLQGHYVLDDSNVVSLMLSDL